MRKLLRIRARLPRSRPKVHGGYIPFAPLYLGSSRRARPLPLRLYRPCRSSHSLHSSIPDSNAENFVTILRLIRSFGESVHRYGNFESAQIGEGVARPALPWLCAFQFFLC